MIIAYRPALGLLALLILLSQSVRAADLELYMDESSKQIFAEPGPGRVPLGTFRPVTEALGSPAPALTEAEPLPVVRIADLEQRIVQSENRLTEVEATVQDSWTRQIGIRGYLQTRYSALLAGDEGINLWSDRSVGDDRSLNDADKNFLLRRARLVFQGDLSERLSFYIQPDLASSAGGSGNVMQMRDAYGDLYLDGERVHRLRVGQSKVPFGFENLQSSSNRLALDRNDALNSAARDERDLGVFYYYTPARVQELFSEINARGLKHTGNYGMFGFGVYNGQGANRGDRNDDLHEVLRFTYPWKLDNGQIFEAGIQAYRGKYLPSIADYRGADDLPRLVSGPERNVELIAPEYASGFEDERLGISFIWYPQPFGLQAEWNWGTTPSLDLSRDRIVEDDLEGGYLQIMYRHDSDWGTFFPFAKWQYFDGANKGETNAPRNKVNDLELGVEWQLAAEVELSAIYHRMKRNNLVTGNRAGRPDYAPFEAEALRLQLQYNY